jgi:hypothetical protein
MEFAPGLTRRFALPVIDTANLRLAHLDGTSGFAGARAFPPERWSSLEAFSPNVLAGSTAQLQRLLERIHLRTVNAGAVDHSIFVVTQLGDTPLTPKFRERLWRQFGVPVYEIYLDEQGRLLAYECEVGEGWHVVRDVRFTAAFGELVLERGSQAVRTGLNWVIDDNPCACGRSESRIIQPRKPAAQPLLAITA